MEDINKEYKNTIYKVNDNIYLINWINFMFINNNIILAKDKDDKSIFTVSMKKRKIEFPYYLLNLDFNFEILYKNDENEWYLLKEQRQDTNCVYRCNQGEYREYKINLSNNDEYDLVMTLMGENYNSDCKYEEIYDKYKKYAYEYECHLRYVKSGKQLKKEIPEGLKKILEITQIDVSNTKTNDPILNILFQNKFPFYIYPDNVNINTTINIKMIKMEGNREKLIIKYNKQKHFYSKILYTTCCGSGDDSFIKVKNEEDMNYFDYEKIENDNEMRNYFKYLL